MGELLQVWISTGGVPEDQLACRPATVPASKPAQPAGLSPAGVHYVLPALSAAWARTLGDLMREPVTKVFRRAGCGKSARPVRRGDGGSRIYSVALRPTLPAKMLFSP